ncbi:LysR family transcriptional regulator [Mesorhizobium sp. 10J20-29]
MELAQVRYVVAAARLLNFTKAAAECNVSQPALTKSIRTLEDDLGAPLFHRESKRIVLSDFGRSLLPHFTQMVEEAAATRTLADNFRLLHKVPVRLGVMSTIGPVRLSRFLGRFQKGLNGVEVAVSEATLGELKDRLEKGELDLAVMNTLGSLREDFHVHPLYEERYVVIFPPDHRLARLNAVKLSDLSNEPYVDRLSCEMREVVLEICRDNQVNLYARFRSEREDWVQAMVLAKIGFAFMPECSVTISEILQRPLVEPEVTRTISLVSMAGRPYSPATAAMVRAAKSFDWPG